AEEAGGMVGPGELGMMARSANLSNTARGPMVQDQARVEALSTGTIAGAGLDVFDTEPLPNGHPLTRLENVVLTPHAAGVTPEALEAGLQLSIENVWNFLNGGPTNVVIAPH